MSLVWQSPGYSGSLRITHVIARRPAADVAIRFPLGSPPLGGWRRSPGHGCAYQRDDVGIVPYDFCIDSRNI